MSASHVGESERAIRTVFERAKSSQPCVVFFDELDALAPRREGGASSGGNNVTQRVVNQMLTEMDGVQSRGEIFVIGATNRADMAMFPGKTDELICETQTLALQTGPSIDPALTRPGRLGKKVFIPLPDEKGRADILDKHTCKLADCPNNCQMLTQARALLICSFLQSAIHLWATTSTSQA